MSKIVLILGAGSNIGLNVARVFSSKGSYKTVIVSRNPKEELIKANDDTLTNAIAAAFTVTPDLLYVPLDKFNEDLNVNVTSAYAAAHEAVEGFKTLPEDVIRTFIYTGNVLNRQIIPSLLAPGIGKAGAAHLIQSASEVYKKDEYRFHWADERTVEGGPRGGTIDGESHGEFYYELATSVKPLTWDATFVAGKGYVDFNGK
ncbi:hypothetical protein SBOR_9363 [Sclerotinia borealis F-4128]|uniref:Short-chain dehydrogenase n=1 Tax=Sclerotinia borealis (strain F-4128) TaxID=1432307 RepID=W9C6P4_SCLBF|nr:hypothetical protein SBOR_9363 [Sclerotinia borealis F-4128]